MATEHLQMKKGLLAIISQLAENKETESISAFPHWQG